MIPSKRQWASWSLPSKLTAVGTLVGTIGLAVALITLIPTKSVDKILQEELKKEIALDSLAKYIGQLRGVGHNFIELHQFEYKKLLQEGMSHQEACSKLRKANREYLSMDCHLLAQKLETAFPSKEGEDWLDKLKSPYKDYRHFTTGVENSSKNGILELKQDSLLGLISPVIAELDHMRMELIRK